MATTASQLALKHFDSFYAKTLGRTWPSVRLGLLSPKKHCLIANSFAIPSEQRFDDIKREGAIDLARYYKKHLRSYHKTLEGGSAIQDAGSTIPETSLDSTTEHSDGMSSAEDLMAMFSDRRVDEEDKLFINKASTQLSLNDFVPATELIAKETINSDTVYYEGYDPNLRLDVGRLEEPPFEFNNALRILTYPRSSWSKFEEPKAIGKLNLMPHYLLDGASILPVLALDVQHDEECADYCAAPGGKSLAILMTLRAKHLLCNDMSSTRLGRMYTILRQYLPEINYVKETLRLSNKDANKLIQHDAFDKILVDVPCSNDRISAESVENNIFKRSRTDERLNLPSKQISILVAALRSIRPQGSVVYSTCTLSPMENDHVVQKALALLQTQNHKARFAIVGLKEAFRPLRGLFRFNTQLDYGQLVMPSIMNNFGPMYISKIKRIQ